MTRVCELRRQCAERLKNACGECASFDADILIEAAYGIPRGGLIQRYDMQVDETAVADYIKRRLSGEPTQYILGEWEFYGLPFYVGEGVLIPRQDTETLVECATSLIENIHEPKVLDLCSGSGCVAVSIADRRKDAKVTAVEFYDDAIAYLSRNILRNGVDVQIRRQDVFCRPDDSNKYDLIVSNPPYINENDMKSLAPELSYEPRAALYGGTDGLDFYRAIAENWLPLLAENGSVAVEIGYDQAQSVLQIFADRGIAARCKKDYGGVDRVIYGTATEVL